MRSRITDKNMFPDFSLSKEYHKIHELLNDTSAFGTCNRDIRLYNPPRISYYDCLKTWFLDWNLRGSFTSLSEMMTALDISEFSFQRTISENNLLDLIQFVLNAVPFVDKIVDSKKTKTYKANSDVIHKALKQNCIMLLDRLNADFELDGNEFYVLYKNDLANAISVEHKDIETSIIDYLKIDTRNDLIRKEEILCTLAKKLEANEKMLLATEFKPLCEDTTFILNKFARHYQNPNDQIEAKINIMNEQEKEAWCDKAFDMFLACMAAIPYIQMKKDIKELKTV